MQLGGWLAMLEQVERALARALRATAGAHGAEPDVAQLTARFADACAVHAEQLAPFAARYGEGGGADPAAGPAAGFGGPRSDGLGLLLDLRDLYAMTAECDLLWTLAGQAAQGARDRELLALVGDCAGETERRLAWLRTRLKQAAPQALVVA